MAIAAAAPREMPNGVKVGYHSAANANTNSFLKVK